MNTGRVDGSDRLNIVADRGRGHYQFFQRAPGFDDYIADGAVQEGTTAYYPFSNGDPAALGTGAETVVMQDVADGAADMVESLLTDAGAARRVADEPGRREIAVALGDQEQTVICYHGGGKGDATGHIPDEIEDGYDICIWRPGLSVPEDSRETAASYADTYLADDGLWLHGGEPEVPADRR